MKKVRLLSTVILFILLIAGYAYSQYSNRQLQLHYQFLIYGSEHWSECTRLKRFLSQKFGNDTILFLGLDDNDNSVRFLNIISVLLNSAIPLPFPYCYECVSKEELGQSIDLLIPLTFILKSGDLKAVVAGFYSEAFWLKVLDRISNENSTYFFAPSTEAVMEDDVKKEIEKIFS